MQAYRQRMEEKGIVQVGVWVEKKDEEFVKSIAKIVKPPVRGPAFKLVLSVNGDNS